MSHTDNTLPYRIKAIDDPAWAKFENHVWCENEAPHTASPYAHGRAVYEREIVRYEDIDTEFVKMIDSNKVKFEAEYVTNWERGKTGVLKYDREAHPGADYLYKMVWYGQEWVPCRQFERRTVSTPIYRRRLVYWEFEPRRKCDIDTPGGQCYYTSMIVASPGCSCCGSKGGNMIHRSGRRKTRRHLDEMANEYNSYGEVGDDPPEKYRDDSWW